MLKKIIGTGFHFYLHGKFRSAGGGSSSTSNVAIHLQHARIFNLIRFHFYHYE
jgi:hypothetical protein